MSKSCNRVAARGVSVLAIIAILVTGFAFQVSPAFAAPPSNDLIENATPIGSLPFTATQNMQDATRSSSDPATCAGTSATVWFRYDAPSTQLLRETTTPLNSSIRVVVYQGTPGSLTQVGCFFNGVQQLTVTGGQTYYFMFATFLPVNMTFSVELLDTAPVLTVPSQISAASTGADGAVVDFTATATDNLDPIPRVTCTPPSGSACPVGDTTVDCIATDSAGLSSHGTFIVHVTDATPPVLVLPGDVTVDATDPAGAMVDYTVTATDNADPNPVVTCTPPAGGASTIGATTVHCTTTDNLDNTAYGSFLVHVNGARRQIENLAGIVAASSATSGLRTSLGAKLNDALAGIVVGNTSKACGALTEFIGQVNAQSGKALDTSTAQQFITDATRIKSVIGCKK